MIMDSMERIGLYQEVLPGAELLGRLYAENRMEDAPCRVLRKTYDTKDDDRRRFEVHGHTIDLMIGIAGSERIHICLQEELTPAEPLPNGGDGRKLDGAPRGSSVLLTPGRFAAIFPGEAHMVAGHPDGVTPQALDKWVVKVTL